jgi:hypothetical protein
MGWGFRRSVKFGPFRLNFSKGGVGASVGVPGNRLTFRADGRVQHTAGLPGTGLRWTETLGGAVSQPRRFAQGLPYHPGRPLVAKPLGLVAWYGLAFLALCVVMACLAAATPSPTTSSTRGASPPAASALLPLLPLAAMIAPIVLYLRGRSRAKERNEAALESYLQTLVGAYGEEVARMMVLGDPWQGATREMIQIMYGPPNDTSTHVHKTMTRETWKYVPLDARRFALRVEFENGACVGWQTA